MALMSYREPNQVNWGGVRPAHNGEQIAEFAIAENSNMLIYTVPAAKTFFLTHSLLGYGAVAAGCAYIYIFDAGGVPYYPLHYDILIAGGAGQSKNASYWPPIELISGYFIRSHSSAVGLNIRGAVQGWIE